MKTPGDVDAANDAMEFSVTLAKAIGTICMGPRIRAQAPAIRGAGATT